MNILGIILGIVKFRIVEHWNDPIGDWNWYMIQYKRWYQREWHTLGISRDGELFPICRYE